MKLPFCHMTLITLQGSVHLYLYDKVDTFNCYIVKHLSLTLCTKFDELLPYCKVIVRKKTFGLFFLWTWCILMGIYYEEATPLLLIVETDFE